MKRTLEPEVMDTEAEAWEYDQMDFREVNSAFAQSVVELGPASATVLDAGTGTARIPILIAKLRPDWQIVGIDLAASMLAIARQNINQAQCQDQIQLEFVDAKYLPYADCCFDGVISNSLLHHLANPLSFLLELKRVLKPGGFVFLRDLVRPQSETLLEQWVTSLTSGYSPHQTQLVRDSLKAALTLEEITELVQKLHLSNLKVHLSSQYHWTVERPPQDSE